MWPLSRPERMERPDPYALVPDWPPSWVGVESRVLEHLALETAASDPLTAARALFTPHMSWRTS